MIDVQRETTGAISNLSNATQANRNSMAYLTSIITTLTLSLAVANDKIVQALAQITVLERELAAAKASKQQHAKFFSARMHYCSTHGPKSDHSSDKCHKKGSNHNDLATGSSRMGRREEPWPAWNPEQPSPSITSTMQPCPSTDTAT